MLDTIINNGWVFDGDATEPVKQAVGIAGERIAYVGPPLGAYAARLEIDADKSYVCPGIIDVHASTGLGYFRPNAADHKLAQGVTTELIGNCGTSVAPIGPLMIGQMETLARQIGFSFDWQSLSDWQTRLTGRIPINVATMIGHSTLRAGFSASEAPLTTGELEVCSEALAYAMKDGGFGLSSGLIYTPGCYASTEELIALAKVISPYGGLYASHLRDERALVADALSEAIWIGKEAKCRVLVSHLKSAERVNWGRLPTLIRMIDEARENGLRITFDVYPYCSVSTRLRAFLPKDVQAGGNEAMTCKLREIPRRQECVEWLRDRGTNCGEMQIISDGPHDALGKSISQVANARGVSSSDAALDILLMDPETWIVYPCLAEEDVEAAVRCDYSLICSDSWSYPVNAVTRLGDPHPRTYGAFTRYLELYSLGGSMPFGAAVRKLTAMAADWLGLGDRGRLRQGAFADVSIFDPGRIHERSTFLEPRQLSDGTQYVWVNGQLAWQMGGPTSLLGGRFLSR